MYWMYFLVSKLFTKLGVEVNFFTFIHISGEVSWRLLYQISGLGSFTTYNLFIQL